MTESGLHQKIKYGDLIYIEFTYEKKLTRNILSGGEFTIKGNIDIEIKKIDLTSDSIYLKDFEENLFIIFPKMNEHFMNNKILLNERLSTLKEKIKTSKTLLYDSEFKNNITTVIRAFQEAKEDVYSENEKFMDDIGKPINYEDDFILIHFKTHCFVQRNETNENAALILTPNYSDECVFFFSNYNSFNVNLQYVFSNQNIAICKREKNSWNNNLFLTVKTKNIEKNAGNTNFVLYFEEGKRYAFQIKICSNYIDSSSSNLTFATPVWLTVQSIDKFLNITTFPKIESSNLDEDIINNYEQVTINNENINTNNILNNNNENNFDLNKMNSIGKHSVNEQINNLLSNKTIKNNTVKNHINMKTDIEKRLLNEKIHRLNSNTTTTENKYHASNNNFKISFDSTDKEKSINNINGLFYIEQYIETKDIKLLKDEYLKGKLKLKKELKMPSFVEYHKIVRFRHIISKKYLGFQEKKLDKKKANNNNEPQKGKTNGNLILLDVPNENCNWMLFESYQNLDVEKYTDTKLNGLAPGYEDNVSKESEKKEEEEQKNESDENKEKENKKEDKQEIIHKIKNNEILRIFHIKTQKFLCFDEVTNKIGILNKTRTLLKEDLYNPTVEKKIYVHNLTLSNVPYDSDLIRLIPFEVNQSLEIAIVLYFKNELDEEIDFITKKNFRKLLGIEDNNSLQESIESNILEKKISLNNINNNIEKNINDINIITYNNGTNKSVTFNNKNKIEGTKINQINYKSQKATIIELNSIKEKVSQLIESFRNIIDYCMNNFSRKYDINISPGKALNYRQQFLFDRGLFKKTFKYLEFTKTLSDIYNEYRDYVKNRFEEEVEAEKVRNTIHLDTNKNTLKSIQTFKKKGHLGISNNLDFIIIELFKSINESIRLSFEFIYSMCKKNNNNKKIAFNYKSIFLYYFLEYEEASKCFMDLLKENENIMNLINNEKNKNNFDIESDTGEESNIIDKILLYLNKSKNYEPKNLSLLSKFLKLGDSGITSNQQYIFEELFYKGKKKFLIKIKPLFDDIAFKVVYKDENKNYTEKNLIEFCNNRVLAQKGIISYLAEQLNLFANLCYGRNYVCIEKIRKMFPLDHLIYHISKVDLNEEIVAGLINLLNYVYIDIEPHTMNVYPSLIKLVTPNLRIERINKDKIKTYITLNKLNLILCLSLFLLNNVKYGSILVNTANINLIFNIIKFHLYENLVYTPMNISEVINSNLNQRLHNLRDEVKKNIIYGEEYLINKKSNNKNNETKKKNNQSRDEIFELINKNEEEQKLIDEISIDDIKDSDKNEILGNINSFYNKYGYKYIEFNFESPLGEEYILFVLDRINDFFLTSLILNNIDNNTEDKNIISQNFKSVTKNDILTQSNINYLMQTLIEIKNILTKGSKDLDNSYILILKQIEKVINFIMDIKLEDMSIYLLENLLKINYQLIDETIDDNEKLGENNEFFYSILKEKLFSMPKINDILMDNEFYYYQLFNKINYCDNFPKLFLNSTNSNENQIMNVLLKKDKIPEENKRMLNNSLFSEEASIAENNSVNNTKFQNFSNDYLASNYNSIKEAYHDNEYYYNLRMPHLEINFENFFINSVILKNLIELIIRILEMNVNGKITKILLRIFKRLMTQRSDLFSNIKNVLLLHKEEELQKYYMCNLSIKELSLLAEKTEKWMTEDHVPRRIINMQPTDNIDIKEIEEDKRDIFLVYYTIYKYLFLIIDPESNSYYEDNEVKLSQKILYSFQMENILSSLTKEIIQEYPQSENTINSVIRYNTKEINNRQTINTKHSFIEFLRNQKHKKNKINEYIQKQNEYLYKVALEKLLKAIFKLLTALVHNVQSNLNKEIIDLVDFSKEYKYLLNLGLLKLIVELSSNNKYVFYNSKFLIDLMNEQIKLENIKQLKEHYFDYNIFFRKNEENEILKVEKNNIDKKKKVFIKSLKGYSFLLKLMKNITTKINDEKNLGTILNKLVEILTEFDIFSIITPYNINNYNLRGTIFLKESSIIDNIGRKSIFPGKTLKNIKTIESIYPRNEDDIYCKISYYRMVFAYYLIKIIIRLIKKNQQIKTYIFSLINIKKLIKFIFEFEPPFSEEQIDSILKLNQFRKTKIFFKNLYYFKLKYIGCSLIFHLNKMYKEKRKYIAKNIDVYYTKLKEDLKYAFYFKNRINKLNKFEKKYNNYNIVYEKYNRHMYKYFFKGIFPLIYSKLSKFNEKLFKDYEDYKRTKNQYQKINISWAKMYSQLYEEKNLKSYKKILTYMRNKKKEYQQLFNIRENKRGSFKALRETKTIKYIQDLEKTLINEEIEENNITNLINNSNKRSDIIYNITINFMNDMISEIENQEVIIKCIKREKKIMARHIKTKINFHAFLKKYLEKESQSQTTYQIEHESELHIVNVFLKFIRENVDNTKYFPVIKELIELMAYLVSVTPEIIKREIKVKKSNPNYFDQKVIEFKENFFYESQKSVLNNGTIEIFLKIASKRGKYFRENVFNIIIFFFLTILEGGNTDVQKKFIQLFKLLQNTDNFFRSINQTFDKDIFYQLNEDPFLEDISLDSQNLMVVSDKLRFLQLLTENHNLFLQNYLREQTNNRISYNFMNILIEYLSMLLEKLGNLNDKYKKLTRYYTELYYKRLLSLLDTICEFLQGPCKNNQEYLIETKIIELFNKIMEETCIVSNEENEDKENNELDDYLEHDTIFYTSKKTNNFDTFFGDGKNYNIASTSTDDFLQDENIKQKKIFSPLSDYEKSTLLFKISLVLLSMIEGRKVKDEVIKKILRDLNYKLVFEKCGEIYTKLTDEIYFFLFTEENTKDIEDLDEKVVSEAGFNLYFLMETLVSLENEETELKINSSLVLQYNDKYDKVQKEKIQEIYNNSETIEKAIQFYSKNSICVEILKDNVVFKVYCPKLPFFNEFDEKMKKKFDENADRNSVQAKLTSLMNEKDQIYITLKQINFLEQRYKKLGPLKYLFLYHDYVQFVGLLLIVLMNILIILGYNAEKDKDNKNVSKYIRLFNLSDEASTAVLHILGIIILCFNIIIFIEFIFKDVIIIYKNLYRNYLKNSYEDKIGYVSEFEIHRVYNFLKANGYSLFFNKLFIYIKLIFNFNVIYRFCYMVFAILGLFVHHFFFAFHLIEFIKSQPILRMVFLVFYKPLVQLISIYIFFFILIYFYSLLIFYRYYDLMPINTCNSPLICMMYIYSNTFSSGGNLGNFIDTNEEKINYAGKMERYALDISYTLIMVNIVWQTFSGLIFAAFDTLRGEREELENDMESTCFICGLDREKIEKYYVGKDGFGNHLQDHSVNNYFFYMFYLEEKDPNEYSGLESYVKKNIDKESIAWFPIGRSLKIEEWENKH